MATFEFLMAGKGPCGVRRGVSDEERCRGGAGHGRASGAGRTRRLGWRRRLVRHGLGCERAVHAGDKAPTKVLLQFCEVVRLLWRWLARVRTPAETVGSHFARLCLARHWNILSNEVIDAALHTATHGGGGE